MNKKKLAIIIAVIAVVVIAAVVGVVLVLKGSFSSGGSKEDKVYVEKVSDLMNINTGSVSSYSGKVESQDTWEIKRDAEKEIKEVYVEVGDVVSEGTELFTYDTESIQSQIDQAELELEGIGNEIAQYQAQIAELEKEKKSAPQDQQLEYTTQIQTAQMSLKQAEYNQKSKQSEIDKYQQSIDNATVTSKMGGVVKEINEQGMDEYGNEKAFMTILATGDYRVKGTLDEQSLYYSGIMVGMPVIIRSRVNEEQTWTGTISEIDTESEVSDSNNGYYDSSSSGESTSKYPFYVTLDSSEDLILGQHVFIEPDFGQTETKEGIWIDASYVVTDEDEPYVWAANKKDRLEKRIVELGEFDENTYTYQILSGLTEDDYITWPMYGLYEGVKTVTDFEEVDYDSPLYNQEGDMMEDGVYEDGVYEDGVYEDGMYEEDMYEDDMSGDAIPEDDLYDDISDDGDLSDTDDPDAEVVE